MTMKILYIQCGNSSIRIFGIQSSIRSMESNINTKIKVDKKFGVIGETESRIDRKIPEDFNPNSKPYGDECYHTPGVGTHMCRYEDAL